MPGDRLVSARPNEDDLGFDQSLRPRKLDEYVGQPHVVANMRVMTRMGNAALEQLGSVLPKDKFEPRPSSDTDAEEKNLFDKVKDIFG